MTKLTIILTTAASLSISCGILNFAQISAAKPLASIVDQAEIFAQSPLISDDKDSPESTVSGTTRALPVTYEHETNKLT
ncbi:MAG: hypothetical protein WBB82_14845 [Limnothrix sp.]